EALAHTLAAGHQSLLFLNRRGYAPLVLCRSCGHRFQCAHCSAWLVMHKGKNQAFLSCHHCGHKETLPDACPACAAKDNLQPCGPGVERLHEEVKEFLPQARLGVLASDSSGNVTELSETLDAMSEGRIDVLIGTQMVAKGHHFANLATVGVVDADLGLAGGDLRAAEHTYQLLHQISGRAGRAQVAGTVYLQSFLPEHPVMQALLSGGRDAFLSAELDARKRAQMPPYTRLAAIIVDGTNEAQTLKLAQALAKAAPQMEATATACWRRPAES
ncbi:MAG: primosomal protein N', partial [Proteobacteria bacterium]|nr:primosomal protein N' [Pseudomonadota bacterium]